MAKADMFLRIEGARQGPIKGESTDRSHIDEIEVSGWSWGMDGNATAFGVSSARTTLQELIVRKRVDRASTGLMAALRNNEVIKNAVLTVRKVGGIDSLPYLTISAQQARVVSHRMSNAVDNAPELVEEFRLALFKIQVEYRVQDLNGSSRGVNTFETEVQTNT